MLTLRAAARQNYYRRFVSSPLVRELSTRLPVPDFFSPRLRASALLDVRSAGEFARGHAPGASSLPLLDDAARHDVGLAFARGGRRAAALEGLRSVGPRLPALAEAVLAAAARAPAAPLRVLCARGGLRSESVAWLGGLLGIDCLVLAGGYQALRGHCLALFAGSGGGGGGGGGSGGGGSVGASRMVLVGGDTGAGKTRVLAALRARGEAVVDLEELAHHAGSTFGGLARVHRGGAQPSQQTFENSLGLELSSVCAESGGSGSGRSSGSPRGAGDGGGRVGMALAPRMVFLEHEARQIGRLHIPHALFARMVAAPLVRLETPFERRVANIVEDYGGAGGDLAALTAAVQRLGDRMGSERVATCARLITAGDLEAAARLLLVYYGESYNFRVEREGRPPESVAVVGLSSAGDADEAAAEVVFRAKELVSKG